MVENLPEWLRCSLKKVRKGKCPKTHISLVEGNILHAIWPLTPDSESYWTRTVKKKHLNCRPCCRLLTRPGCCQWWTSWRAKPRRWTCAAVWPSTCCPLARRTSRWTHVHPAVPIGWGRRGGGEDTRGQRSEPELSRLHVNQLPLPHKVQFSH